MYEAIQQASKKPNFFILGAAKCGTTALHHYLSGHPDIYMSPVKETCFFCDEYQVIRTEADYLAQFAQVTEQKAVGESSHVYLTSPGSPEKLKRLFPDAKFLLIFRHPADRAFSLYLHMRRMGLETAATFEEALALEPQRMADPQFRRTCPHYFYNFCYFHSGLFGEQLDRYLALFPEEQFFFTTQQALRDHPTETIEQICRFLGVSNRYRPDPIRKNEGATPRFPRMQARLARWGLVGFLERHPRLAGLLTAPARHLLTRLELPRMHPDTRRELAARYADDQARFRELTGLELGK